MRRAFPVFDLDQDGRGKKITASGEEAQPQVDDQNTWYGEGECEDIMGLCAALACRSVDVVMPRLNGGVGWEDACAPLRNGRREQA